MKCPRCGTENPEDASFCRGCGQPIKQELICPQCGHANIPDSSFCNKCGHSLIEEAPTPTITPSHEPTSFVSGRYQVINFLGEGGKKKVYLAHDSKLDRDVAFALLKTEKLDKEARTRITREARAMGRLGSHRHIVTIHDFGEEDGQPYMVAELMTGGDVEGLIEKAPEHRLPLEQAVEITKAVCQGLDFAHANGIIHRDLKPGNVWISDDGTAKIGDFGLAVAANVSRLTEEGMMVGTAFYMPPEQAMGQEVTPRADIYSLGAMLYEMVTGRPPFIGDTSVAIITQHIDTSPPISPTWHRADLSPGLEALIMQLLEKDPAKRPASAADVLKVLDSIDLNQVGKAPTEEVSTIDRGPLYRRVFVGRESELKQLQSAFDGAASGNGALMMVVGEPGIGKTAICEQLSTYATLHNGKTLVGHCYEEGSLSLPYLAFIEAMRSYVLTRETRELRRELGTGAADVARIVSEIREKLKVKPKPSESPEEERYRLFQAVTGFLTNAATVQPLLIILEDLHDADKGTLEMLTHVSRNLSGARLLIIGTYRDVEVDRAHPLSASLAELRRVASYDRITLRGLNADEVHRMMNAISGQDISWGLAETVHRQTEGNPLFVQEVLRYLRESGVATGDHGRWQVSSDTPLAMAIPEGLRDVIGKRLSLLSTECNRILSIVAVIGREFRLDTLQKVADTTEEELFTALEEAKAAGVLEERSTVGIGATFRFTHAFFRQTLYEETFTPRRIRIHQQVGSALEEIYARRREEHAAELAEHFAQSTEHDDLVKALEYSEMAAERAWSVYAYGENVRLLEQALKVQDVLDPEDKIRQCDLLRILGNALSAAGDPQRAIDIELPKAFFLAESIGDRRRAYQVCRSALRALTNYKWGAAPATSEYVEWTERINRYAEPGTVTRVMADMYMGAVKYIAHQFQESVLLLNNAINLARQLGDSRVFLEVATMWLAYVQSPQQLEKGLHLAEELYEISLTGSSRERAYMPYQFMIRVFLESGQYQLVEELSQEYQSIAKLTGQANILINSMTQEVRRAVFDGCLEKAVKIVQNMLDRGKELGFSEYAGLQAGMIGMRLFLYLGRTEEALELSTLWTSPFTKIWSQPPALCLAHLGRDTEVKEILGQIALKNPRMGSSEDESPSYGDIMLLETAVLVGKRDLVDMLLRRFVDSSIPKISLYFTTCYHRHLGAAVALLDRPEEACKHYQDAIKVCTEMRFRPELALTRLQLAELLLEHYPDGKKEALEHLDFAINEFREMKMQPSLERALKHKEILGA